MSGDANFRGRDLALRAAGLLLVVLGVAAMRLLFDAAQSGPLHASSLLEIGSAATGFIGLSMGASLTGLGAHIFDAVETSERWRFRDIEAAADDSGGLDENAATPALPLNPAAE